MVWIAGADQPPPLPVPQVLHFLRDAMGSVIGLTNADGNLVERYTYDPYGKTLIEKWDSTANGGGGGWVVTNASSFGNPFAWTGQRYDAATGTYHFWARTYSPYLGRWLQRDPAGNVDGVNLYEYVRDNPTHWTDPFGLRGEDWNDGIWGDANADIDNYVNTVQGLRSGLNTASEIAQEGMEFTGDALITAGSMLVPIPGDEVAAGMMLLNRLGTIAERLAEVAKTSQRAQKLLKRVEKLVEKVRKITEKAREERAVQKESEKAGGVVAAGAKAAEKEEKGAANVAQCPKKRGGDSDAARYGRKVHEDFKKQTGEKGWNSRPRVYGKDGSELRPDALDPKGRPVELKPDTPTGHAAGEKQIEAYKDATGTNGRVIYYPPPPPKP